MNTENIVMPGRKKEIWALLRRNLTPAYSPPRTRTEHAFISFRTNPDEPKAQELAALFQQHQIETVPLHGGERCPFKEIERNQAINWIHDLLDKRLANSYATVVIATAASLKSQWVYHEYTVAAEFSVVVFLLWFDGDDPSTYFLPTPTWLMRRSPSSPVYLLDLREKMT